MADEYKKFCSCKDQADLIAMAKCMEKDLINLQRRTGLCGDFLIAAMQLCVSVQVADNEELREKLLHVVPDTIIRAYRDMAEQKAMAERNGATVQ